MRSMSLSGLSKLVLGIFLAAGILFGAGVTLTRYLLGRLATPPPRPVFANEPASTPASSETEVAASPAEPAAEAEPSPESSPVPSPTDGYTARVTQPIGLILRDQPSREAGRIGGIEFNQQLTVLEDSPDGAWQRVRLANGAEGWVRAGNTERLN
jgi:hypothetical protein